jgi:hypothetical protein
MSHCLRCSECGLPLRGPRRGKQSPKTEGDIIFLGFNKHIVHKMLTNSPRWVIQKAVSRAATTIAHQRHRRLDLRHGSGTSESPAEPLTCYFSSDDLQALELAAPGASLPREVLQHYMGHRLNLLGSGWVQVRYGMQCRGLGSHCYEMSEAVNPDRNGLWLSDRINASNLVQAQHIWRMIDENYVPIDWHLDFKSGYRWDEKTWSRNVSISPRPGADIKVPWELARCQHFPQMALAYSAMRFSGKQLELCNQVTGEFRNQVLDFLALNPPRFGVNWQCSMDVGIRIVNWLVAYDLFSAAGVEWDDEFNSVFASAVHAHGQHIVNNLEWFPEIRNNHYLANVAGLLFAAAYLPSNSEQDAWLSFAVGELIREVELQFTPDGATFEASTSYHRLAAEVVTWSTGLVLAFDDEKRQAFTDYDHQIIKSRPLLEPAPLLLFPSPDGQRLEPFPAWYWERLERMAEFTIHTTKPTGHIHQVGDNDSGRFLNLQPVFRRLTNSAASSRYANLVSDNQTSKQETFWDENSLDHRSLIAAVNGLFLRDDFKEFCGSITVGTKLIGRLIGGRNQPTYSNQQDIPASHTISNSSLPDVLDRIESKPQLEKYEFQIELPCVELLEDISCHAYQDFGLYIWRSERFYLAVRCGPVGQNGLGGHAHNDQLAIELSVENRDWIADPGTFIYFPDLQRRNAYRSVAAHFAPQSADGREPGRLDLDPFQLHTKAKATCLYFKRDGFVGCHWGFGEPVYRTVRLTPSTILITDYAETRLRLQRRPSIGPNSSIPSSVSFSPGYGIVERFQGFH